jgi:hypothetical protein
MMDASWHKNLSDWNGVNFNEKQRATMVAKEFGCVGFAADIYGPKYHAVESTARHHQLANKVPERQYLVCWTASKLPWISSKPCPA